MTNEQKFLELQSNIKKLEMEKVKYQTLIEESNKSLKTVSEELKRLNIPEAELEIRIQSLEKKIDELIEDLSSKVQNALDFLKDK